MKILLKSMTIISILIVGLHSMENQPLEYNPLEKPSFTNYPNDMKRLILEPMAIDFCLNLDNATNLQVVCKDWQHIIDSKEFKQLTLPIITWHSVFNHIALIIPVAQNPNLHANDLLGWVFFMKTPIHKWCEARKITDGFAEPRGEGAGSPGYGINLSLLCNLVDFTEEVYHKINETASLSPRPDNFDDMCNRFDNALTDLFLRDGGQGMMLGMPGWNLCTRMFEMFDAMDSLVRERHGRTLQLEFEKLLEPMP